MQETITVTAAAPVVDTVSVALGTVIEQKQMAELPLLDRSYSKLIVLAPGANEIPAATAGGQFQQFFGRQPQYTVSGARPEGQVFLMDNTNVQNYWNRGSGSGQLGTTLGVEAIAEYQVLTNTYSAQFGGNGVAINAITKSGTNQWHGSMFEYYRNDRFDASNYFDTLLGRPDPTLEKNQFGGSVGGPLVRNKAFFFVTYEGLRQTLGQTQAINVPDANARNGIINGVNLGVNPAIAPVLQLYPLPTRQTPAQAAQGIGRVDLTNETPADEDYFVGRFDYTIAGSTNLFVRYTGDVASVFEANSGSPIPLWNSDDETSNHYVTAELRQIVTPRIANAIRLGGTRTQEQAQAHRSRQRSARVLPRTHERHRQSRLRRRERWRKSGPPVRTAPDPHHRRRRSRLGRRRTFDQIRRRVRAADDVRQPAAVRRRVVVVSEPDGIPAEPAIAVPGSTPRSDRRGAQYQGMASHELHSG